MDPTQWDAPLGVVVAALWVIVMARANATFWFGRLAARGAEGTRLRQLTSSPGYIRAVDRLNRWGPPVVTVSFLTVGVQTVVNLAAGGIRMPQRRYLPAVTLGCLAWALIYGTVGFVGVEALALLWQCSPGLTVALGVLGVGGFAGFVAWRVRENTGGHGRSEPAASSASG